MKTNKLATLLLIFSLVSFSAFADMAQKRSAALLTTSYVACTQTICDEQQLTVEVYVTGTPESVTCSLKPQWSTDGTNWFDEPVNSAGTASATEQPYTRLSKVFQFSVNSSAGVFSETFTRWGGNRYFRVVVKGASATTTALVSISVGTSSFR